MRSFNSLQNAFRVGQLAVGFSLLLGLTQANGQDQKLILRRGTEALTFDQNGALVAWGEPVSEHASAPGEVHYAGRVLKLVSPVASSHRRDRLLFTYRWPEAPELEVTLEHRLTHHGRVSTWTRRVQIQGATRLSSDLTVSLLSGLAPLPLDTWLPLVDGTGAAWGTNQAAAYRFAGHLPAAGALLGLPMVSVPFAASGTRPGRTLLATDPYFSVRFTPTALEWTYPARVGLENGCEQRSVLVSRHPGEPEDSLQEFFRAVLPDVPPGPPWLHQIAMVDYDYMSDGGQGWFRDIDALTAALPKKADRRQVLLCLHGWYDFLGRYCFDTKTKQFDPEWAVFSSYEVAKKAPAFGDIGGEQVELGFGNCKPVKISLPEVHTRLRYARTRGYRVGLYFADGMNAGEGLPDFEPGRVLRWGGWQGPDSKGRSYFQNPLHPKVREFFLDYTKALLAEFGPDLDALNWDETFHIEPGDLGSDALPGYADRAMMRLVHEVRQIVDQYNHKHHRQVAFLTSDCLGAFGQESRAPYALVAHGTYQDSWCQPQAWSYGIFANYRNVLWSCCWWPVTKWPWIDFGVRQYQAPVAISNGWGNDRGFAEMTEEQRARALALFHWRKGRPTRLHWLGQLPVYPQQPR